MKECILDNQQSLTKTLGMLNKLFVVLQNSTRTDKKVFLKTLKKNLSPEKTQATWTYIEKKADAFRDKDVDMTNPIVLFKRYKLEPYIGKKSHGVMFCEGMVIGLTLALSDKVHLSYRVDYDPDKKLHINFEMVLGKEKYPICIPLYFSTGRYGFSKIDKASCTKNKPKELALLELTKVKFWLKMTLTHTLVHSHQNQACKKDDTLAMEKQLLAFVQGQDDYSFESVKQYLIAILPNDIGKFKVYQCKHEQELLQCIHEKYVIRFNVRHSIFSHIATYDSDGNLLSGLEYHADVSSVDSEERITSDYDDNSDTSSDFTAHNKHPTA